MQVDLEEDVQIMNIHKNGNKCGYSSDDDNIFEISNIINTNKPIYIVFNKVVGMGHIYLYIVDVINDIQTFINDKKEILKLEEYNHIYIKFNINTLNSSPNTLLEFEF